MFAYTRSLYCVSSRARFCVSLSLSVSPESTDKKLSDCLLPYCTLPVHTRCNLIYCLGNILSRRQYAVCLRGNCKSNYRRVVSAATVIYNITAGRLLPSIYLNRCTGEHATAVLAESCTVILYRHL